VNILLLFKLDQGNKRRVQQFRGTIMEKDEFNDFADNICSEDIDVLLEINRKKTFIQIYLNVGQWNKMLQIRYFEPGEKIFKFLPRSSCLAI
jgi:hypothetical protein